MPEHTPPASANTVPGSQRLVALVLLGLLAFNYPLLFVFGDLALLFGIPILYLYLFLIWGLFIALGARILERPPEQPPPQDLSSSEGPR